MHLFIRSKHLHPYCWKSLDFFLCTSKNTYKDTPMKVSDKQTLYSMDIVEIIFLPMGTGNSYKTERCTSTYHQCSHGPYLLTMRLVGFHVVGYQLGNHSPIVDFMPSLQWQLNCVAGTGGNWTWKACCLSAFGLSIFYGHFIFYTCTVLRKSTVCKFSCTEPTF